MEVNFKLKKKRKEKLSEVEKVGTLLHCKNEVINL